MANSEYQQMALGLQAEEELEGLVDSIIFASDDGAHDPQCHLRGFPIGLHT